MCLNGTDFPRAYCTDQSWKSPNCLNVCSGGSVSLILLALLIVGLYASTTGKLTGGFAQSGGKSAMTVVTHCPDGSWCCGPNNLTACCDKNLGFQNASSISPYGPAQTETGNIIVTATVSSISTISASASVPDSSTSASTPVPANKSNVLEIGLGVSLGVVALVSIALAIAVHLYRRNRKTQLLVVEGDDGAGARPDHNQGKTELEQSVWTHEISARKEPVEMGQAGRKRNNWGVGLGALL